MLFSDKYKEIKSNTTGIYKEKGSKFIAYAYPVYSEEQVKEKLEEVKKLEHSARHHCYAYVLHADKSAQRANDNGEPSSTAGNPILGQIQSNDLTNILIIVVRYFGGVLTYTMITSSYFRHALLHVMSPNMENVRFPLKLKSVSQ